MSGMDCCNFGDIHTAPGIPGYELTSTVSVMLVASEVSTTFKIISLQCR